MSINRKLSDNRIRKGDNGISMAHMKDAIRDLITELEAQDERIQSLEQRGTNDVWDKAQATFSNAIEYFKARTGQ